MLLDQMVLKSCLSSPSNLFFAGRSSLPATSLDVSRLPNKDQLCTYHHVFDASSLQCRNCIPKRQSDQRRCPQGGSICGACLQYGHEELLKTTKSWLLMISSVVDMLLPRMLSSKNSPRERSFNPRRAGS